MKRSLLILISVVAAGVQLVAVPSAVSPAAAPQSVSSQRPRMWLTPSTLLTVRARMASGGDLNSDARVWANWLDANYGTAFGSDDQAWATAHYAFAFLLLKDGPVSGVPLTRSAADYANRARSILLGYIPAHSIIGDEDQEPLLVSYDWLHPMLSQADRVTIAAWFQTSMQRQIDTNPFNSAEVGRRGVRVLAGLALAGDGIADQWAQAMVGQYPGLFRSLGGVTRSESDFGGYDGGAGQGTSYMFTYTVRRTLLVEEAYRTAMGISKAEHYGGEDTRMLRLQPQHFAYSIIPGGLADAGYPGGRQFRIEKAHRSRPHTARKAEHTFWLSALAGLYETLDPNVAHLAKWLMVNRTGNMSQAPTTILRDWLIGKFIMGPSPSLAAKSPDQLGLPPSRRFASGKFIFQDRWDDANSPYVIVHASEWMRSAGAMTPFLPGAFQVFRKGPLAINQGGTSTHDWGAMGFAGSANILIFPDRSITAKTNSWDDEGGHRRWMPNYRGSIDFVQNSIFDSLDEVKYLDADRGAGRDVDYVSLDLTRSYSSTRVKDQYNPARVSEVIREFVYFRGPGTGSGAERLVVLDRATTTDTRFNKEWLFHTSAEPFVDGPVQAGPVRNGHSDGHSTYTAATRVTATNTAPGSNGRVWLTPLLPQSRLVIKIGGPDATGASWTASSHEFESPYGVQGTSSLVNDPLELQYIGKYRIEVTPVTPKLSDVFLNVVEANDSGVSSPSATALLAGSLIATRVGDRIAVFNTTKADLVSGNITVDAAGTYGVHFANLKACGSYRIQAGSAVFNIVASTAGTYYLNLTVGANTQITVTAQ